MAPMAAMFAVVNQNTPPPLPENISQVIPIIQYTLFFHLHLSLKPQFDNIISFHSCVIAISIANCQLDSPRIPK